MLESLKSLLPNAALDPIVKALSWSRYPASSVDLPAPPEADYRFHLTLRPERQIHANPLHLGEAHYYFWYRPFEEAEFGNSIEKLDGAFLETVERLVSHETRIVQKRGLLNHSFRCDYKSQGEWKRVYGHSALRFGGFVPPPIAGRKQIYYAPALILHSVQLSG
jgi:hypothetical protein